MLTIIAWIIGSILIVWIVSKKFRCACVGHKPPIYAEKGSYSPGQEYGRVVLREVDGIGRQHAEVRAECARCKTDFRIVRIHVPEIKSHCCDARRSAGNAV